MGDWMRTAVSCAVVALGSGCEAEPSATARPTASASGSARPSCEGREVVSLVDGPRVLRGTVKACQGQRLTIAYGHPLKSNPRPERDVDATNTWDVGQPAKASVGDLGACHAGRDLWKLCKVTAAEGGRFRVASPEGQVREIAATDMITFAGDPRKKVADHFSAVDRERAFDEAVLAATFDDGRMKTGQRVVAPRVGTSFYEGTIVSLDATRARIRWTKVGWPERDVPRRHVGLPDDPPTTLDAGRIVLWRKKRSDTRFEPARVVATGSEWQLRDRSGAVHRVASTALTVVIAADAADVDP